MTIKFYKPKDPYGFLSNFWPARMFIYHSWWNWVEAPFQAAKTLVAEEQKRVWEAKTARESRNIGQIVSLRPDWEEIKRDVMKKCCMAKFLQHADLRKMLMETGDQILVEDSPIDAWWGCGKDGNGKNVLGHILMEIRSELQGE